MYIEPNSVIKLLNNVPLDNTYNHTIRFDSLSEQTTYFNSKVKYTFSNQSYQRVVKGRMRLGIGADQVYDCNYLMFQNTGFGNKWFYAFVTGVEYACSKDHYGKYLTNPRYINAGVLLFNITKCKETKIFETARWQLKRKKWLFADQDALWHSTTKNKLLPQKFNDQKFLWKSTVVRHFSKRLFYLPYPHTANIKQWNVTKIHKIFGYECFDDILYEYIYLKKKFEKEYK